MASTKDAPRRCAKCQAARAPEATPCGHGFDPFEVEAMKPGSDPTLNAMMAAGWAPRHWWLEALSLVAELGPKLKEAVGGASELRKALERQQAPAKGKRDKHFLRRVNVFLKFRVVETRSLTERKSLVVREELDMTLPTYRKCVKELRGLAERDDSGSLFRAMGIERRRETIDSFPARRSGPRKRARTFHS